MEASPSAPIGVRSFREEIKQRLAAMPPAYFALSMATGIVSIACHLLGLAELARLLFWLNVPIYGLLWGVTLARAVLFPSRFFGDWASHQRGPGFFTSVAATCVVGVQFVMLRGDHRTGYVLWWIGLALWVVCTYAIFVLLSVRKEKPSLEDGINGGWLVAVVATQSICVLGCKVVANHGGNRDAVLFVLACFWLCGGMLYTWMISLIFYRYTFFRFAPSDLMPPYWINMGAVAISTLAGSMLVVEGRSSPLLTSLEPFIKGFTTLYWATATWWIPMLVILGIWRHGVRRFRFAYDPLYWGLVFPLGMYSVCTYWLARILDAPFLLWIARGFVVVALVAWLLTFSGLATRLLYLVMLWIRSLQPIGPHAVARRLEGESR